MQATFSHVVHFDRIATRGIGHGQAIAAMLFNDVLVQVAPISWSIVLSPRICYLFLWKREYSAIHMLGPVHRSCLSFACMCVYLCMCIWVQIHSSHNLIHVYFRGQLWLLVLAFYLVWNMASSCSLFAYTRLANQGASKDSLLSTPHSPGSTGITDAVFLCLALHGF